MGTVIPAQAGIHELAMVIGRSNLVIPAQAGIHPVNLECGIWNGNLKTCKLQLLPATLRSYPSEDRGSHRPFVYVLRVLQ
jgi:hypothetical protein